MKKSFKKLLAGILTATMIVGTMGLTAWASEEQPSDPTLNGIATYDTEYNQAVTAGSTETITLQVTGMDTEYQRMPLTNGQASDVQWTINGGELSNSQALDEAVSIVDNDIRRTEDDGWVSYADIDVSKAIGYGFVLVKAELSGYANGIINFGIVINPKPIEATVTMKVIPEPGGVETTYDNVIVEEAVVEGADATYPNPLAATMLLANRTPASGPAVTEVVLGTGDNKGTVQSMTVDTKPYPSDANHYWAYSVTDESGKAYGLADDVGAGVFMLHDGDIVTWTYVEYEP